MSGTVFLPTNGPPGNVVVAPYALLVEQFHSHRDNAYTKIATRLLLKELLGEGYSFPLDRIEDASRSLLSETGFTSQLWREIAVEEIDGSAKAQDALLEIFGGQITVLPEYPDED